MFKTKKIGISLVVLMGVTITSSGATTAEGIFEMGPKVGYSKTPVKASAFGVSDSEIEKGPSTGLVVRYTVPLSGSPGILFGVHAAINREFISWDYHESGVVQEVSTQWSLDIMPRIGYRTGKTTLSISAGFSTIQSNYEISALGISFKDKNWHTGWKIAPGIDYQLSENVALFGQLHYAEYSSETYNIAGISVALEPKTYGVGIGILYGF